MRVPRRANFSSKGFNPECECNGVDYSDDGVVMTIVEEEFLLPDPVSWQSTDKEPNIYTGCEPSKALTLVWTSEC